MQLGIASWQVAREALCQVVYPARCQGCFAPLHAYPSPPLCKACLANLRYWPDTDPIVLGEERYAQLGILRHLRSLCVYEKGALAAQLIHAFKYHGQLRLGRWLAQKYADSLANSGLTLDYEAILAVPMHWWALNRRGFNQGVLLCREMEHALSTRTRQGVLRCIQLKTKQVRLSAAERKEKVKGKYIAKESLVVRGGKYLLVDDVITTGATTQACAQQLFLAGAAQVDVASLAAQSQEKKKEKKENCFFNQV